MSDYNIIDGEKCCWRCGLGQNTQEYKDGMKCSVWGHTFNAHLWKAKKIPKKKHKCTECNGTGFTYSYGYNALAEETPVLNGWITMVIIARRIAYGLL